MKGLEKQLDSELQGWKERTIQVTNADIEEARIFLKKEYPSLSRRSIIQMNGMILASSVKFTDAVLFHMTKGTL